MSTSPVTPSDSSEPIASHQSDDSIPAPLPPPEVLPMLSTSIEEDPSEDPTSDDAADFPVAPPARPIIPLLPGDPYAGPPPTRPSYYRPFVPYGTRCIRAPRKSTFSLPARKRPLSPTASYTVPPPACKRQKPPSPRRDWQADTLRAWRLEEGFPSTFEVGESSQTPRPIPSTGEPAESTIPLLVARSARLGHQLFSVSDGLRTTDYAAELLARRFAQSCQISGQSIEQLRHSLGSAQGIIGAQDIRIVELEMGAQTMAQRLAEAEQRMQAHLVDYAELLAFVVSRFPPPT